VKNNDIAEDFWNEIKPHLRDTVVTMKKQFPELDYDRISDALTDVWMYLKEVRDLSGLDVNEFDDEEE
jgi:hypothetical protein